MVCGWVEDGSQREVFERAETGIIGEGGIRVLLWMGL